MSVEVSDFEAVPEHQRLVLKITQMLIAHVPDGEVFVSPIALYLDEHNVVEPDVLWVSLGAIH